MTCPAGKGFIYSLAGAWLQAGTMPATHFFSIREEFFTMRISLSALALTLFTTLLAPMSAQAAAWYPAEFSADILIVNPRNSQERAMGTLYIGDQRFRADGRHKGEHKVLIVRSDKREAWTLFPDKKQYYIGIGKSPMPPKPDFDLLPDNPKGPCQTEKSFSCSKVASGPLNGVPTDKWDIRISDRERNRTRSITMWVDTGRGIIIKHDQEGGPAMERRLLGTENIGGRETEKWEIIHSYQEKKQVQTRWVDSRLRIPVRTTGENGAVIMELTNIREGTQPGHLFELPPSYAKIAPPAQPMQPGRRPRGGQPGGGGYR